VRDKEKSAAMISNAPAHVFIADSAMPTEDVQSRSYTDRFLAWFQQALCGLHGHDAILQYERNRMFLRCTSCGHETPGWEVSASAAMVRHRPVGPLVTRAPRSDLAVVQKIA
jgi:hypothetical protein